MRPTLFCICLLAYLCSYAQKTGSSERDMTTGSLNISISNPSGEFREFYSKPSLGISLSILSRVKERSVLYVGGELSYHNMGYTSEYNTGNYSNADITATSNLISLFPRLRVQSPKSMLFNPFAEASAGLNMFYSYVSVKTQTSWDDDHKTWRIHKASFKPGFGFAGGVHIRVGRKGENIEVRTAYIFGGRTNYYTNPDISSTGEVSFSAKRSRTNMLQFQLGINI